MSAQTAVLNDLLEPVGRCLGREGAAQLAALRAPASVQARIDELAAKSTAGALTDQERAEYEALVSAGTFIAVLQSKARKLLKDHESS